MRGGGNACRKCVEEVIAKFQSVDGELGSHAVDLGLLFGVVR
jgi:hypothetical protein